MFSILQPVEVDIEYVKEAARNAGNSEAELNPYQMALNLARKYTDEGLTPVILHNPMTNAIAVTSKEQLESKLH